MIYSYLCCNTVAIQKELTDIASLVKEMLGKSKFLTDSTHSLIKQFNATGNDDVDCINEDVLSSVDI
jgi:hypothetical protein